MWLSHEQNIMITSLSCGKLGVYLAATNLYSREIIKETAIRFGKNSDNIITGVLGHIAKLSLICMIFICVNSRVLFTLWPIKRGECVLHASRDLVWPMLFNLPMIHVCVLSVWWWWTLAIWVLDSVPFVLWTSCVFCKLRRHLSLFAGSTTWEITLSC